MRKPKDTAGKFLFGFCLLFVLLCVAVIATSCVAPKEYECKVWQIEGTFITNKLHNRYGQVELWRFDEQGNKRVFLFHQARLTNCKVIS